MESVLRDIVKKEVKEEIRLALQDRENENVPWPSSEPNNDVKIGKLEKPRHGNVARRLNSLLTKVVKKNSRSMGKCSHVDFICFLVFGNCKENIFLNVKASPLNLFLDSP